MKKKQAIGVLAIMLVSATLCFSSACTGSISAQRFETQSDSYDAFSISVNDEVASADIVEYATIDIDDPDDRALVNGLLDEFTEALSGNASFEVDSAKPKLMAQFAVGYIGLREPDLIEDGEYTDIAGVGGGILGTSNARIPISDVQDVVRTFFAYEIDLDGISSPDEPFTYVDGYLYFGRTAPFGQTCYYPAVTAAEELGEGRYRLDFDVVSSFYPYRLLSNGDKLDLENDVYPLASEELQEMLGGSSVSPGEAVVRVEFDGDGKSIALESLRCGYQAAAEEEEKEYEEEEEGEEEEESKEEYEEREGEEETQTTPSGAIMETVYETGATVTLPGILRVTSDGPLFSGKGLWAYVELPHPIYIEGGQYYVAQLQYTMQVGIDEYFKDGLHHELSLPYWEPYDGKEVLVRGTLSEVLGMSIDQMGAFRMEDAEVVEELPQGTIEAKGMDELGLDAPSEDLFYVVNLDTSPNSTIYIDGDYIVVIGPARWGKDVLQAAYSQLEEYPVAVALRLDDETLYDGGDMYGGYPNGYALTKSEMQLRLRDREFERVYIEYHDGRVVSVGPLLD